LGELIFELLLVILDEGEVLRVLTFFLLLNGRDSSPGGSSGTDGVLVSNGEKVSLFDAQFIVEVKNDLLDVVEHVFKTFRLFTDFGHVDEFVSRKCHFLCFFFCFIRGLGLFP